MMIGRVGSFSQAQSLINEVMQQQTNMAQADQQVSTGFVSPNYQGMASQADALLGAQAVQSQTQNYANANTQLSNTLQTYNTALTGLASTSESLRQAVMNALATNSGTALMSQVQSLLQQASDQLNTQVNGQYIFGGTNTGTPPVNTTTTTALAALGTPPAAAFSNNQTKLQAQVDQNTTVTYGQLASSVGTGLLQSIQGLAQFNAGTVPSGATGPAGAFGSTLTASQQNYLNSILQTLSNNSATINDAAAQNGTLQSELQTVQNSQTTQLNTLSSFISNLQDVNSAQAISNLNQDQVSLQASYNVIKSLSQLSLANFL